MNDHDKRFSNDKANNYIYAQSTYPYVMKNEFEAALELLKDKLQNEIVFVNIPGDILFDRYLPVENRIEYIPYEFNDTFANMLNTKCMSTDSIDLPDKKADIILSIAGLHHFNDDERLSFYKECKRVLKPDGVLLIGEVLKGSAQDKWLNEYVNAYNSNGHKGIFFDDIEANMLEDVGFNVEIKYVEYTWDFDSVESMCDYCINLFGLDKIYSISFLRKGIKNYLDYSVNDDLSCQFSWGLVYFKSTIARV